MKDRKRNLNKKIKEENWLKVAKTALVLGLGLYIIPLAMVRHPSLIDFANLPVLSILTSIQIGLGLFFVFSVFEILEINSNANLPRLIFSFWKN